MYDDIKQVKKPVFVVGDREFPTREEAVIHRMEASIEDRINVFIASRDWPRGQERRARSICREMLMSEAINTDKVLNPPEDTD